MIQFYVYIKIFALFLKIVDPCVNFQTYRTYPSYRIFLFSVRFVFVFTYRNKECFSSPCVAAIISRRFMCKGNKLGRFAEQI